MTAPDGETSTASLADDGQDGDAVAGELDLHQIRGAVDEVVPIVVQPVGALRVPDAGESGAARGGGVGQVVIA